MDSKPEDEKSGWDIYSQVLQNEANLEEIIEGLSEKEEAAFRDVIAWKFNSLNKKERKKVNLAHRLIKIKRASELTLDKVLGNPKKYSKGVFWETGDEFGGFIDAKAAKSRYPRLTNWGYITGTIGAFGMSALPHELIHAYVNSATGGINKEIVLNKFFGGSLWAGIIPNVQAKWLIPLIGGYVDLEPASRLSHMLTLISPYCLSPAGIAMFYSGLKRKNAALFTLGAGITGAHIGGVIGDFWNIGKVMLYQCSDLVYKTIGYEKTPETAELMLAIPIAIAGFFIGNRIMGYSYNLMKGGYNSLRKKLAKQQRHST